MKNRKLEIQRFYDLPEEEVYYCKNCLSLAIKKNDYLKVDICLSCGNADIERTTIEEWEEKYFKEYKKKYLEIKK